MASWLSSTSWSPSGSLLRVQPSSEHELSLREPDFGPAASMVRIEARYRREPSTAPDLGARNPRRCSPPRRPASLLHAMGRRGPEQRGRAGAQVRQRTIQRDLRLAFRQGTKNSHLQLM